MTPAIENFSKQYLINITEVRRLLLLASKAKMAKEKALMYTMPQYEKLALNAVEEFEKNARELGFGTVWNALWPRLVKSNQEIDLPL